MKLASSRLLIAVSVAGLFCLAPSRVAGQAAPTYKDPQEFQLYDAILKDTNPKTKLEKIQDWEKKYPDTQFTKERKQLYFTTYIALNMPKETVAEAKLILADNPKDFNALYYSTLLTRALYDGTQASVLDDGQNAATTLLSVLDTPPAGVDADKWAKLRPDIERVAHLTLGFIAIQRKTWDGATDELKKALVLDPGNGITNYLLYIALASKKDYSSGFFYYTRAAWGDGPNAVDPQTKQGYQADVTKLYTTYHGSAEGFSDLQALAKAGPNPPDGFHIKSKGELAKAKFESESKNAEQFAKDHPDLALWKSIKETLAGAGGAEYFNSNMKDAKVTTLRGKVVKLEPAAKPKVLLLAMEDGTTADGAPADATLKFEAALPGTVEVGTELTFEGVGVSYTASPLMVVFNVDKADLHGWTGKAAAPAPVHHTPVKKK
jgi:tetratricopeptide (TPR) repeat protein